MNIIKRHIPKGDNNPEKKITVDKIVIHYSGEVGCSADLLATCLINNHANNVSANYCVDEKQIIETIPPGYMSYGVSYENNHIINIETCYTKKSGEFEPGTIENLHELVLKLMADFKLSPADVVRHYDLSHTGKWCPYYYIDSNRWAALHEKITAPVLQAEKLYRVQVGAFTVRENAENYMNLVKSAGFPAFIVEVERSD